MWNKGKVTRPDIIIMNNNEPKYQSANPHFENKEEGISYCFTTEPEMNK